MRGYEVTVKVMGIAGAFDTFELLADSREMAAVEGIRLFRERHPNWSSYALEPPDVETGQLLTEKLLAMQPQPGVAAPGALGVMLEAQLALQVGTYGYDPTRPPSDEARIEFIRWNVLALEDELHEFLGECGWKPWATSRHVNAEAALEELVDLWHFLMNLLWSIAPNADADALADSLTERYFKKRERNAQRQVEGYDGVSTKCLTCRRALDDPAVACTPQACSA